MTKPLSLILPDIEAVWSYEPYRFDKLKAALDGMDYNLCLQVPAGKPGARHAGNTPGALWDEDESDDTPPKPYRVENGIALLALSGPMTKQYTWLSYYYGGTSTQALRTLIRLAVADPDVTAILLTVYSPGGQVAGTQDLAQDIAWAGTKKPLLAFIEDLGCSAAYWAASQASDGVYINNGSCTGGSAGTIMGVDDTSKANEMAGVKTYIFASGDRKGIGTGGTEITDAQRAYLQSYIESVNVAFLGSVQAARKLTAAQMADVRRAGVYVGQEIVAIGLADGIATSDECKAKLQQKVQARKNTIKMGAASGLMGAASGLVPLSIQTEEQIASSSSLSAQATAAAVLAPAAEPAASSPATTNTQASMPASANTPRAGGEGKPMKEILVRALSALKLHRMAVAITASTDDSPQALAQNMIEQVEAEVTDRLHAHPLMLACAGAGINDVAGLQRVLDLKSLGEQHIAELRDDARAQCIRAHGPELGAKIGRQIDTMGAHEVKVMRDAWQTQADATFGHGENGQAAQRASAPRQTTSANAEETQVETPKTAWEQLTVAQREHATRAGHAKNPEAQEKFATEYLSRVGK